MTEQPCTEEEYQKLCSDPSLAAHGLRGAYRYWWIRKQLRKFVAEKRGLDWSEPPVDTLTIVEKPHE